VGGAAQSKVMKSLAGSLKLELAQYREIVEYISLGLSIDASTKFLVAKGSRLQTLMTQGKNQPVDILTQILLLYGGLNNFLNDVELDLINFFERKLNYLVMNGFFFNLLENTIRLKVFPNVNQYIIFCLKILVFKNTKKI
jgi:F0F1-type ATP synthase alpha subunit